MIELESTEWKTLKNGALVAALLRQFRDGDDSAFGELYNQVCHQYTVSAAAYMAVPHMVAIARSSSPHRRALLLCIAGSIVASMNCNSRDAAPLHDAVRAELLGACDEARILASQTLREAGLDKNDSFTLIGALAAFHGHHDLAIFMNDGPKMYCPSCGESIAYGGHRGS